MPFNSMLLRKLRDEARITRLSFARQLDITEDYLYKIEAGSRRPSIELMHKMARTLGAPIGAFFDCDALDATRHLSEIHDFVPNLAEMQNQLNREREERMRVEEDNLKKGKLISSLLAMLRLYAKLRDTMALHIKSNPTLTEQIVVLAKETVRHEELDFKTICSILKIKIGTLKTWLGTESMLYRCKLELKEPVYAATPKEAGLCFVCFECAFREKAACKGYGEQIEPTTIFELVAEMERNGITSRKDQARFLEENYGIHHSPAVLTEYIYRNKKGKHVPENVVNMEIFTLN